MEILIKIFSFTSSFAQSFDEVAIRKVLTTQEAAWNSGDIEKFMKGYWVNDSLMFIGNQELHMAGRKRLTIMKKDIPILLQWENFHSIYYNLKHYLPFIIL